MKIAHYEESTQKLLGWYDTKVHKTVPTPNIEVTEKTWQQAIDKGFNCIDIQSKNLFLNDFRTPEEITAQTQAIINDESLAYLASTDRAETRTLING